MAPLGNIPALCRSSRNRIRSPSWEEKRDMTAEHLRRLVELNELKQKGMRRPNRYSPEEATCIQFRTHIPYYVKGMFDKKQLLMKLARLLTVESIMTEGGILVSRNQ